MRRRLLNAIGHTGVPARRAWQLTRVGTESPSILPWEHVWTEVVALYRTGLHPAIGLSIRHRGRVVLDRTIGHVEHQPGAEPGAVATPDTPFNLFSASKILTAMVVHALVEDGVLELDAPIATYLPELATRGKERIRVRHLLSHTAGIPNMPAGIDISEVLRTGELPWQRVVELPIVSEPGTSVAYHPVTSWSILEQAVLRTTGHDLRTLAHERLLAPVGIDALNYGIAPDRVGEVAKHAATGLPAPTMMARIFERTVGTDLDTAVGLTNDPAFLTAILPSANVIGTGRQVTRFLDLLLGEGELDGTRVLKRETVRRAIDETTPLRFDGTFGFPMRYSLGLMRGGTAFSLFGLDTKDAFGHLGFTNVVVFADPSRQLSVSFLNTGKPMFAPGMVQWYRVLQTISSSVPRGQ